MYEHRQLVAIMHLCLKPKLVGFISYFYVRKYVIDNFRDVLMVDQTHTKSISWLYFVQHLHVYTSITIHMPHSLVHTCIVSSVMWFSKFFVVDEG
jgi:hypothetical protein